MLLALSWATLMHTPGWAQTSHFAQTRAIAAGEKTIDRWQWETMDKGWIDGHFYSVKAPGVALLSAPLYAALKAAGAKELATDVAHNAADTASPNWTPRQDRPWESYGYSRVRAQHVERHVERETPLIWALALLTSAIPGLILLLLVRWVGDRFVPGYGTAAAFTLGAGTIVMSFASIYASHVLSACLLFAAFAVLLRERDEERARLLWLLGAGLLAGFAVTTEYPLAIGGAILFAYALLGAGRRLPRGAVYAAGAVAGAAPALAFNDWTLGSPTDFAYSAAVAIQGFNGHAVLGLNSGGFFGIGVPNLHAGLELLVGGRSLLALTPVLGAAVAGLVVMWRRGERRAEWAVLVAMAAAYLLYNAGYWLPLGGGTPGPRFLTPMLPFLAIGLAYAYRRLPATTIALAIPSVTLMTVAAITFPLLGEQGTGQWGEMLFDANFEHTLLTAVGVSGALPAILPVLALLGVAAWITVRTSPTLELEPSDLRWANVAVAGWFALGILGPIAADDKTTPLQRPALLIVAGAAALAAFGANAWLRRAHARPPAAAAAGDPPSSSPPSPAPGLAAVSAAAQPGEGRFGSSS